MRARSNIGVLPKSTHFHRKKKFASNFERCVRDEIRITLFSRYKINFNFVDSFELQIVRRGISLGERREIKFLPRKQSSRIRRQVFSRLAAHREIPTLPSIKPIWRGTLDGIAFPYERSPAPPRNYYRSEWKYGDFSCRARHSAFAETGGSVLAD